MSGIINYLIQNYKDYAILIAVDFVMVLISIIFFIKRCGFKVSFITSVFMLIIINISFLGLFPILFPSFFPPQIFSYNCGQPICINPILLTPFAISVPAVIGLIFPFIFIIEVFYEL